MKPSFKEDLADEEIHELVKFIKKIWLVNGIPVNVKPRFWYGIKLWFKKYVYYITHFNRK